MKRIIATIIIALTSIVIYAQGEFDALKYNQLDINGTARYMGMCGAFGALGGDASSISSNPAGLGIYRSSELSFSSGVVNNNVRTDLNDKSAFDSRYNVPINNMTYVINFDRGKTSGLVNSNFAISFNKLKNFNRNVNIKGGPKNSSMTEYIAGLSNKNSLTYDELSYVEDSYGYITYDPYDEDFIPWLSVLGFETYLIDTTTNNYTWNKIVLDGEMITPSYSLSESGYINEWAFSYAANINDKIYIGASLGIQDIDYTASSRYTEDFELYDDGFVLINDFNTYGSGINFKFGTILRPFNFLRLGASVSTPTFYTLTDTYSAAAYSQITFPPAPADYYDSETPIGGSYYKLQGPMQATASAALILDKVGIISADYGFTNYTSMILRDDRNLSDDFSAENEGMSSYLQDAHSIKVGAEIKLTKNFAIRAGYGLVTSATDKNARKELPENTMRTDPEYFLDNNTNYMSTGFGYREDNWFFDFAYLLKNYNQDFYAYNLHGLDKASVNTRTNNFIATLGFKF